MHLRRAAAPSSTCGCRRPDDLALYDGRLVLDWVRDDDGNRSEIVAKRPPPATTPAARTARMTTFFDAWRDGGSARRDMRREDVDHLRVRSTSSSASRPTPG